MSAISTQTLFVAIHITSQLAIETQQSLQSDMTLPTRFKSTTAIPQPGLGDTQSWGSAVRCLTPTLILRNVVFGLLLFCVANTALLTKANNAVPHHCIVVCTSYMHEPFAVHDDDDIVLSMPV
jgi:hypothetical protein